MGLLVAALATALPPTGPSLVNGLLGATALTTLMIAWWLRRREGVGQPRAGVPIPLALVPPAASFTGTGAMESGPLSEDQDPCCDDPGRSTLSDRNLVAQVMQDIPGLIYLYDPRRRRMVSASARIARVLGLEDSELSASDADPLARRIHPEDRERLEAARDRLCHAQPGETVEAEFRLHLGPSRDHDDKSSSWRWFHDRLAIYRRDSQGHPLMAVGLMEDVTLRVEAHLEATRSHRFLTQISSAFPLMWMQLRAGPEGLGRFEMLGGSAREITGLSNEMLCSRMDRAWELVHPDDHDWLLAWTRQTTTQPGFHDLRFRIRHAQTGELRWLRALTLLERDPQTNENVWSGVYLDITRDIQRIEEAGRLAAIAEAAPQAILQFDFEERPIWINAAARGMLGVADDEPIPRDWMERLFDPDTVRSLRDQGFSEAVLRGSWSGTGVARDVRYGPRDVEQTLVAWPRIGERDSGVFALTLHDVTAHARAERLSREAARRIEQAGRLKDHFLANVSHEIRSPLFALQGYAELLASSDDPQIRSDALDGLRQNSRSLLRLVCDLLDISKVHTQTLRLNLVPTSPLEPLNTIIDPLLSLARAKGLGFQVELLHPLPRQLPLDGRRVSQVLHHLIENAIKYTYKGTVIVRVGLDPPPPHLAPPLLRIDVIDTGLGMTPEEIERFQRVFEFQENGLDHVPRGLGMGSMLVTRLVEWMGGRLEIQSHPGQGSRFSVRLPVAPESLGNWLPLDDPLVVSLATLSARLSSTSSRHVAPSWLTEVSAPTRAGNEATQAPSMVTATSQPTFPPSSILVVEDNPDLRRVLTAFLTAAGWRVETASDGEEGLAKATTTSFDLILMDLQMPRLDGVEATRRLRARGVVTPIVALTANDLDGERQRCLDQGFDDYLTKPVGQGELIQRLAQHLGTVSAVVAKNAATPVSHCHEREHAAETKFLAVVPPPDLHPQAAQTPAHLTATAKGGSPSQQPHVTSPQPLHAPIAADSSKPKSRLDSIDSTQWRDPEFFELVNDFAASLPFRLDEMDQLWHQRDTERVRSLAHQLKGAGGMFGFRRITSAASALERVLREMIAPTGSHGVPTHHACWDVASPSDAQTPWPPMKREDRGLVEPMADDRVTPLLNELRHAATQAMVEATAWRTACSSPP